MACMNKGLHRQVLLLPLMGGWKRPWSCVSTTMTTRRIQHLLYLGITSLSKEQLINQRKWGGNCCQMVYIFQSFAIYLKFWLLQQIKTWMKAKQSLQVVKKFPTCTLQVFPPTKMVMEMGEERVQKYVEMRNSVWNVSTFLFYIYRSDFIWDYCFDTDVNIWNQN